MIRTVVFLREGYRLMCGIGGYVQASGCSVETGKAVARAVTEAIGHRGPDDAGIWLDAEAGVAFGHRRASIIDLSPAGDQPMVSASGRRVIAFNGKIYNHVDVRQVLQASGIPPGWRAFRYRNASGGLRGMGHQARCGGASGCLRARDRTERLHPSDARSPRREKPLYYGWAGDALLYGVLSCFDRMLFRGSSRSHPAGAMLCPRSTPLGGTPISAKSLRMPSPTYESVSE
ncbi:MAG: hypothetical protein M3461_20315 [Pseudomonadota bacterium]|nr:hypothetical protein [Pseudomonadota bacterium]